jgi:transposase
VVAGGEWRLAVQTTATTVGCRGRGYGPSSTAAVRSGCATCSVGGRPLVLAWPKRIWRCREPPCGVRTWTERAAPIRPRAVLTQRARAQACRRVGKDAHAVAAVARDLGRP